MTLEELTSALRDEGALRPERKRALRVRVLRPRRRIRAVRWLLPVAAVLAGLTAWAGAREHKWGSPSFTAGAASHERVATVAPAVTSAPSTERVVMVAPHMVAPQASAWPAASATHPKREDVRLMLDAYRAAEHLQFDSKDYAGAFDAWNHYLALGDKGPLVVDARYARALCLMHLGRSDEARTELSRFAEATPGSYRQAEARALLDSIR